MAIQSITTIKTKFETGDVPTQQDFIDLIDTLIYTTQSRSLTTYTATAAQDTFNVTYATKANLDVFYDGHRLTQDDFTATNGTSITLSQACIGGEKIEIVVYNSGL